MKADSFGFPIEKHFRLMIVPPTQLPTGVKFQSENRLK